MTPVFSRRAALGGGAAVLGAAAVAGAAEATPAHPDAELIRMGARIAEIDQAFIADPRDIDVDATPHLVALLDEQCDLMRAVEPIPARTMEGLRVKARILDGIVCRQAPDDDDSVCPERLTRSLINDLLAGRMQA